MHPRIIDWILFGPLFIGFQIWCVVQVKKKKNKYIKSKHERRVGSAWTDIEKIIIIIFAQTIDSEEFY